MTDRAGNERVWEWDATKPTKTKLTERTNRGLRTGEGDYETVWTHDADRYLLTTTLPRGNGIKRTLNAAKLPIEIRRKTDTTTADNNTNDIVETFAYDSARNYCMTSHTDGEPEKRPGATTSTRVSARSAPRLPTDTPRPS